LLTVGFNARQVIYYTCCHFVHHNTTSAWTYSLCNVFSWCQAGTGKLHEMKIIFCCLAAISQMLLHPYFIFDSLDRPWFKPDKEPISAPPLLVQRFQELLTVFGFSWHTAPGEVEAELAYFHSHGLIDAVVTLFSDVLLFGATSVIRRRYGDVKVYTSDALQHSPFLKWEDLLLMVLMNGAGYDVSHLYANNSVSQFGLPNCNVDISHRLARYGLGRSLVQAVANQKFVDFMSFITKWCKDLCWVLERDPEHHLGWRYYELACVIEEECTEFPNPAILAAYLSPLMSWSSGGHPPVSIVTSHQPDLTALAVFCLQCLGWSMDSLRPRLMDARASAIIHALLQVCTYTNVLIRADHILSRFQATSIAKCYKIISRS
ncbi:hypothetical protein V8B97DRAFT_1870676, partial [Scleroderma yunnanense]